MVRASIFVHIHTASTPHQVIRTGPCVRISPWEVHIQDVSFIESIISTSSHLDKDDAYYYRFAGTPSSSLSTGPAKHHKQRRAPLAPLFSKASVLRSVGAINARVRQLLSRLDQEKAAGRVVDLSRALRCLAFDVIADFALPRPSDVLSRDDGGAFSPELSQWPRLVSRMALWQRQLGFIVPLFALVSRLPQGVLQTCAPKKFHNLLAFHHYITSQAAEVIASHGASYNPQLQPGLFHSIVLSSLPPGEKTTKRLIDEALSIVGPGIEGPTMTCIVAIFNLTQHPACMSKLKAELAAVPITDTDALLHYEHLQSLPYLSAVIFEALRLGKESGRLARVSATTATTFGKYVFPPGTVFSVTLKDLNLSPAVYEKPESFNPERWLNDAATADLAEAGKKNEEEGKNSGGGKEHNLKRRLMPFSRGARVCLGRHLAEVEICIAVANLVRKYDFAVFETEAQVVGGCHDFFAPAGSTDSDGLRVWL
ncbi:MAG: hypothetical protein LQ344_005872 [Seirophora lacunosa]|nr:MAG: hypothetical protein LQ344_005872 [Seirophora lacunosa]